MARGICSECDRDRDLCAGMCRTCRQVCLDVDDGESPGRLTGRWVPHPSLPIRVYEEMRPHNAASEFTRLERQAAVIDRRVAS